MVACLEKSEENLEFHQIVDFLSTCSINYALTISPTIYASYIEQFWNTATSKTVNLVKKIHAIVDGKAVVITESSVRSDILFNDEDGIVCLTNDEIFENLAFMGYEQLSIKLTFQKGNGYRWQCQAPRHYRGAPAQTRFERVLEKPNEPPLSEGHTSGSGEGSMEYHFELTDNVPPTPHDSPLPGGCTPGSDEGRLKLQELMTMCTKLSKQVLDLEKEKDAQAVEILKLKKRVESSDDDLDKDDASKQGRKNDKTNPMLHESDFDGFDDETVDAVTTGASTASAPVTTVGVAISIDEPRTPPTTTTVFDDEDVTMAMAQTLIKMKEFKAKEKWVEFRNVEEASRSFRSITTFQPLPKIDLKDKGKSVLVEEEPKKVKSRDQGLAQIESDAKLAQRLHEKELEELDRAQIERKRQEEATNAALAKEFDFDEIQAKIDADALFAAKL
ncbi:hypothetical protein Tco_1290253 [Tanacetum coccineum]